MLTGRKKLVSAIGFAMLIILICIASGIGIVTWIPKAFSCYDGNLPLKSFNVNIAVSQQGQFVEQFRRFANKNGYLFLINFYTPDHEDFLIQLIRRDTSVIASNPFAAGDFIVGFYNFDCIHPTVVSDINGLVVDLKSFISMIPNAVISEEK
jgi:hypothetical protein